ncbi:MAG: glutamate synthase large subunit [Candidatus Omnitrophota bacterium]
MKRFLKPVQQGLYDPRFEHDNCGVGFICHIKGEKSHAIIKKGITVLQRLAHRGAVGADPKTGDGAGILIQMPHKFFLKECSRQQIKIPCAGRYGSGLIFLPSDKKEATSCMLLLEKITAEHGQKFLGWRDVPCDDTIIGQTAKKTKPIIRQAFIECHPDISNQLDFEKKLYLIRKQTENGLLKLDLKQQSFFYITNLSSRTLAYKGLLMTEQLENFFPDLKDPNIESALCLVHSRYSTNTFPTWDLAQPFRFLAHNGEINTLRGNLNWMKARESLISHTFFKEDIEKLKPIITPGGSDSAAIDNVFELLTLSGRSLAHTMMMLIPTAWQNNSFVPQKTKDFYKYHSCIMEPWDGPAAIAFTDGTNIGAVLDRNGLRPARYLITKDDLVIMASEAGVLDTSPEKIKFSGRLEPGKMFFINTQKGEIIEDAAIKKTISTRKPYGKWLKENTLDLSDLPRTQQKKETDKYPALSLLKTFGYTREELKFIIKPMAETGTEPIGSMGNDTPHAVLSQKPKLIYDYFKQLFAQVTNPAIDPIREELVMSLESHIGSQKNILDETPQHCHMLHIKNPILSNEELEKIRKINKKGFKTKTISLLFDASHKQDFLSGLNRICQEARTAIEDGYSFIILCDKGTNAQYAAFPALVAIGAIHQFLVQNSIRARVGLILESAEPREVHHFALLFGYGADAINPYLTYDVIKFLLHEKELALPLQTGIHNYRTAVKKGLLKILSKMGISTLQSYKGAQIFEALGLDKETIDRCFTGTSSRIGGANLNIIAQETIMRHNSAYCKNASINTDQLPTGGVYQWRRDGEFHLWNPETIAALQNAVRNNRYEKYQEFANLINNQSGHPTTLRSLMMIKTDKNKTISLNEVEPTENILKRFATGAMSFGSISKGAHETLALAMNRIGARSNTGEGGEDPQRFKTLTNGESRRSAIKQVASGRFGVTTNYLINADELQIKISQGAKPGEGGQLPGHKVSAIIAKTRYTTPGVTLISPPPHHDIYSIEDLAQLIFDLKNVNPKARISVKLVSEIGVGTIAAGVAKGHADMILISGGDGGTGASPLSSIKHAGLPWELGLSETHQTLILNGLRDRVRLQTDGQMRTGRDVAIAALLGAEEYGFCTAALIAIGCTMLRHCHLNNCALGIATQDPVLEKRFNGKPEYVINYFYFIVQELREIMASLGIKTLNEMIGRTDLLEINKEMLPWKAKTLDYSKIFYKPKTTESNKNYCCKKQHHAIDHILDHALIKQSQDALINKKTVNIKLKINNTNRSAGVMLSGEVCRLHGENGLPDNTIQCKFTGIAGQSFGAFLAKGVTFELEGMANDYTGKGISGGKIVIYPFNKSTYCAENNIIIGNTTFYGAIAGEAYIRGIAGERFCIRNSGLNAVVEGVGDHGCEYMTGGTIVILGKTGRNFAAGMSGGTAYIYDFDGDFKKRCNMEMVRLKKISDEDKKIVRHLLTRHTHYTQSSLAKKVLNSFSTEISYFVKVMPIEYERVLEGLKIQNDNNLSEVSDG